MNDITFQKALASVMLDNKYDRFVKNRRTGKLDTRSLFKIETSAKLFKRREARKNKDYAVSLVVDVSGSMSGPKIKAASWAAGKLSWHLSRMAIPHNVVVFATHAAEAKPFGPEYDPTLEKRVYDEVEGDRTVCLWDYESRSKKLPGGLEVYPFIGYARDSTQWQFRDEYRKSHPTSNVMGTTSPAYNSDAEALMFARKILLAQKGTKLMIFLSDGQPAPISNSVESPINPGCVQNQFNLKDEVERTIRSGIELYSVGIMDDSVNKYYPPQRTCVIRKTDALYPHIITLVRRNLRRG